MKKITFWVLCLIVAADFCTAQELYVNAGIGFAFPQAAQTLDGTGTPYNGSYSSTTYTSTYSLKKASFSSGTNGMIGLGYFLTDHVGIELNAMVNLSGTTYTFNSPNVQYGGYLANEAVTQRAKTNFMVLPTVVLQTGGDNKWNLYGKLGLALPVSTAITEDQVFYIPQQTETDDYSLKIKNSFSLGFTGALGVKYRLNDNLSVWGEMNMLSLSLFIKEADLTAVSVNGTSIPLSNVSGPQTIKYSKNVIVDSNGANQPTYSQPFSSIGFRVGLSFTISRHERRSKGGDEYIDKTKPFRRNN